MLILQQFYRLGNDPITNKTVEFLHLQHSPSFVFKFVTEEFLCQGKLLDHMHLGQTQEDIDANLMALKVSQDKQHEAASSFPSLGLLASKRQAGAEAAWSSAEVPWLSAEEPWMSADPWPSAEESWPSVGDTWSSADVALSSSYHGLHTNTEDKGKIYNHYNDFFAAHKQRQKEMMKVETP